MTNPAKTTKLQTFLYSAFIVWILLVLNHYFSWGSVSDFSFVSTAFSDFNQASLPKMAANGFHFLKTLLIALWTALLLWRAGRRLGRWLGLEVIHDPLRFCLEMALGILLLNALWLGLGLNGLWWSPLLGLLALTLLGFALWDFFDDFMKIQKFPRLRLPGWLYLTLGGLGASFFILALFQGEVPDVYFDALVYHLTTLEFWKNHHGIADFYTNLYSYYPFGGELYFLNGYFFGGSEAAKVLNSFAAGFCGLAAGGWVMEEANLECGWLTGAMVLSIPLVSAAVWTTQNDVVLAFFLILFFYALARWAREKNSLAWAIAAGLLGGAALTVKYTAIMGIAVGCVTSLFFFEGLLKSQKRGEWLWILTLGTLSFAPWFLKNTVYTGNAFYPYLSSFLGGRPFPVENMGSLMGDHEAVLNGNFSLGSWLFQVLSKDLDKTIAPLFFGFIPFLFLKSDRKPATRFLLALSGLWLVLGFLVSHQLRLMIPVFVTALTALGLVLGEIKKDKLVSIGAWAAFIFGLVSFFSLCRLQRRIITTARRFGWEKKRVRNTSAKPRKLLPITASPN